MMRLTLLRLLGVYSVASFVAIVLLLSWCSTDSQRSKWLLSQLPDKAEVLDKIYELERSTELLRQSEAKLHDLETQLRRKYPKETPLILDKVIYQLPWIYAITPTYARPVQKAELTRLIQTLLHVKNFHWIVVEDSLTGKTPLVSNVLANSGVKYTHLNASTPPEVKLKSSDPNWLKPRGVLQRNRGLRWLRENRVDWRDKGVVYFLDDDNTYDLRIFEEMRFTETCSVWPVGLVGGLLHEKPLIDGSDRVVGWHSGWKPDSRPFAMDMAGFAVNLKRVLDHPDAYFSLKVKRGYQEGTILKSMNIEWKDLEPKADNCTKIFVWHTRTEKADLKIEKKYRARGMGSSDDVEV